MCLSPKTGGLTNIEEHRRIQQNNVDTKKNIGGCVNMVGGIGLLVNLAIRGGCEDLSSLGGSGAVGDGAGRGGGWVATKQFRRRRAQHYTNPSLVFEEASL